MPGKIQYYRPPGQAEVKKAYERAPARQEDKNFYSSTRWRKLRASYLASHPLCESCQVKGITTFAEHVHHRHARKTHPHLALDWVNLKAVCPPCHLAEEIR
jgi:5-methylcytosine-specific restriction protein A